MKGQSWNLTINIWLTSCVFVKQNKHLYPTPKQNSSYLQTVFCDTGQFYPSYLLVLVSFFSAREWAALVAVVGSAGARRQARVCPPAVKLEKSLRGGKSREPAARSAWSPSPPPSKRQVFESLLGVKESCGCSLCSGCGLSMRHSPRQRSCFWPRLNTWARGGEGWRALSLRTSTLLSLGMAGSDVRTQHCLL